MIVVLHLSDNESCPRVTLSSAKQTVRCRHRGHYHHRRSEAVSVNPLAIYHFPFIFFPFPVHQDVLSWLQLAVLLKK